MQEKQVKLSGENNTSPAYVVGIGASAGGLEAIQEFFDNMPPNEDIAFVVIQHLSPDFKSLIDQLLAKNTLMDIRVVEDGMCLEANVVYLIPPKNNMTLSKGKFSLTEQIRGHGLNLPIDIFFHSLAIEYGMSSIAIVLSGTGSDGSKGIIDIDRHKGLVITQDPDTAKFNGMPRSAIDTQVSKCICLVKDMPGIIKRYINDPENFEPIHELSFSNPNVDYAKIFNLLFAKFKINFNNYKPSTISRRIERRMKTLGFPRLSEYAEFMQNSENEFNELCKDLLIGVTSFFRDKDAFAEIKEKIAPHLLQKYSENYETIRIWVPSCSTGEEVYSIAMLLQDYAEQQNQPLDLKIFATDVSKDFLDIANQGVYSAESVANIPKEFLQRFFKKSGDGSYQVCTDIRNLIVFSLHNLLSDPPFTKMDMISCRNFLIYIQPEIQTKLLRYFEYSLNTPGFLFLGSSETLGELGSDFEVISAVWKIYKKLKDVRYPVQDYSLHGNVSRYSVIRADNQEVHTNKENLTVTLSNSMYYETLNYLVSCGLLVDSYRCLVHIFGDASKYIKMGSGNIQKMDIVVNVLQEIKAPLNTTLHRAKSSRSPCSYTGVTVKLINGEQETLKITVYPLYGVSNSVNYYLTIFENVETNVSTDTIPVLSSPDEQTQIVIEELERELQESRESLQATIEELETTNEELQSTNEELLASNEELQSTNEELHSVNEELYTVNAEHQIKISELTMANTDIDNILRSTNIGAIFVNKDLEIRFFTHSIAPVYNLMESDLGRSIRNFTHILEYDELFSDIEEVIKSGKEFKKEVRSIHGKWYLANILPYLTDVQVVDGAIITLVDISKLRYAKLSEDAYNRLNTVLKNSNTGIWNLDLNAGKVEIDQTIKSILALDSDSNILDYQEFSKYIHAQDRDEVDKSINSSFKKELGHSLNFRIIREDKSVRNIIAESIISSKKGVMTGTFRDVTEKVNYQNLASEFENRKIAMDDITDGWWDWDLVTNEEYLSPKFKAMFGYADHELPNSVETWQKLIFKEDLGKAVENFEKHIKSNGESQYIQEVRYKHKDGHVVWVICRGKAIADKDGNYVRMIGTHTDITELKLAEGKLAALDPECD